MHKDVIPIGTRGKVGPLWMLSRVEGLEGGDRELSKAGDGVESHC